MIRTQRAGDKHRLSYVSRINKKTADSLLQKTISGFSYCITVVRQARRRRMSVSRRQYFSTEGILAFSPGE